MKTSNEFITTYFTEEKIESLFFIILGLIAILLALIFWFIIKYAFYNGLAYPLLLVGIIQLTVGSIVYLKSDKDMVRIENYVTHEPNIITTQELPRMQVVMKNFTIYKTVEITLLLIGLFLFFYTKISAVHFWKGLGLGLIIQSSIMLSLDLVAEKRGISYISALTNTINTQRLH